MIAGWVFYNALLPLLPIPFAYLAAWPIGASKKLTTIIRDGQLCFYSTSLCAVTMSDLLKVCRGLAWGIFQYVHCSCDFVPHIVSFIYGVAIITMDTHSAPNGGPLARASEAKLGLASIATALVTLLFVLSARGTLGLWQ